MDLTVEKMREAIAAARKPADAHVSKEDQSSASVPFKKQDDELQVVWGEVYAPGFPDSQGDYMSAETVREMAYGFMKKSVLNAIDTGHSQIDNGCYVVESFIARDDDPTFIPGSWVVGVKVPDPELWGLVKSGELNGYSLDGFGVRVEQVLEVEVPDLLKGETDEVGGHRHGFVVRFDNQGNFLGGQTTEAEDGHYHEILKGTVTETVNGHSHRFSFVEGILNAKTAA